MNKPKFGIIPNSTKLTIIDTDCQEYCAWENLDLNVEEVIDENGETTEVNFHFTEE